jgi:hypothetical protein
VAAEAAAEVAAAEVPTAEAATEVAAARAAAVDPSGRSRDGSDNGYAGRRERRESQDGGTGRHGNLLW